MNLYLEKNTYANGYMVLIEQDSKQVWDKTTEQAVAITAAHYADRYALSPGDDSDGVGLSCFTVPPTLPNGRWLALFRDNASPANTDEAVKAVEFEKTGTRIWRLLPMQRVY